MNGKRARRRAELLRPHECGVSIREGYAAKASIWWNDQIASCPVG